MTAALVKKPEFLSARDVASSAIVEASAGTGKTFAIEHLVADAVLAGLEIDQILVITFTEKAAEELGSRVREVLASLHRRSSDPAVPGMAGTEATHWRIDDAGRARLERARRGVARAPISTIHGFCNRVLHELPFAANTALDRDVVPDETVFETAFEQLLRQLPGDPQLAPWVADWTEHKSLARLGRILREIWARGAEPTPRWRPDVFRSALERLADTPMNALSQAVERSALPPGRRRALLAAVNQVKRLATSNLEGKPLGALREAARTRPRIDMICASLEPEWPQAESVLEALDALRQAAVPEEAALVQMLLPGLERAVRVLKAERGWMSFGDMVNDLDRALDGPRSLDIVARLRAQYRLVLVDEFQDTDAVQWRIVARCFAESPDHRLILVGDPKQAIYGFRGADIATYLAARDQQLSGGAQLLALEACFRSTPELIDATNRLFTTQTPEPFFSGGIRMERPLRPGRPDMQGLWSDQGRLVPVQCLRWPKEEPLESRDHVRRVLATGLAETIAELFASGARTPHAPLRRRDVFVLTRTLREAYLMAAALRRRGLPAVITDRRTSGDGSEREDVLAVLRAVADPSDPALTVAAYATPFFGVPPELLHRTRDLPVGHPWMERLLHARRLADDRRFADMIRVIVEDGDLLERSALDPRLQTRWPGYEAILSALLTEAERVLIGLPRLIRWLEGAEPAGFASSSVPLDAVRVSTIHGAKGLEAEVVAVFGALFERELRLTPYHGPDGWSVHIGDTPPAEAIQQHREEEERLLYVALTRARRRVFLPFFGGSESAIDGPYGKLDRIVAERVGEPGFEVVELPMLTGRATSMPAAAEAPDFAPPDPPPNEPIARSRRGDQLTSYTQLKERRRGPETWFDDRHPIDVTLANDLPGGAQTGKCLHALLETVDLDLAARCRNAEDFCEHFRSHLDRTMKRFEQPREHREAFGRMVFDTLVRPLPLSAGRPLRLIDRPPLVREMDFAFRDAATGSVVRGFMDVVLEFEGRLWVLDYKSDSLPEYGPRFIERHVAEHHRLQAQVYAMAIQRWRPGRELGGVAFIFLRAPADQGVFITEPAPTDIAKVEARLKSWEPEA